jgi:hypothetical protein
MYIGVAALILSLLRTLDCCINDDQTCERCLALLIRRLGESETVLQPRHFGMNRTAFKASTIWYTCDHPPSPSNVTPLNIPTNRLTDGTLTSLALSTDNLIFGPAAPHSSSCQYGELYFDVTEASQSWLF